MAKGSYIGVSAVARKIKKMYIGVGGVAHAVKKAYIGVGGVARLWWSGSVYGDSLMAIANKSTGTYGAFVPDWKVSKDDFTNTVSYSPNVKPFQELSEITKFKGKYYCFGFPKTATTSNYKQLSGIYYSTTIGGTYTLAKATADATYGPKACVLMVYNGYLYGIFAHTSPMGEPVFYIRSSDGTSWPSLTWSSYADYIAGPKQPLFAIYNGNLYASCTNKIVYVPISSMSSGSGNITATTIVQTTQSNNQFGGQIAFDTEHEIAYTLNHYNYSDSTDLNIYAINLKTHAYRSSNKTFEYSSTSYRTALACLYKNGRIYIDCREHMAYATAPTSWDSISTGTWIPSWIKGTGNGTVALYSVGDKILRPWSQDYAVSSGWYSSSEPPKLYYRIDNTLTFITQLVSSGTQYNLYLMLDEDKELFDYSN